MGNHLDIKFCATNACSQEIDVTDIQKGRARRNSRKLSKNPLQSTPQESIHSQSKPQLDSGALELDSLSLRAMPAVSTEQSYIFTPEADDSDYSSDISVLDPFHHAYPNQSLRRQSHSHLIRMRSHEDWDSDDYDDLELEMKVEYRRLSISIAAAPVTPVPNINPIMTDEDGIDLDLDYSHIYPSIDTPSEPGANDANLFKDRARRELGFR